MEAELGSDDENHDHLRKDINSSDDESLNTDEEALRKEMADMIDSNEDLSDGMEAL